MPLYRLSREAERDLKEIALYSMAQWGERRTDAYMAELEASFCKISANKEGCRPVSSSLPQVRYLKTGRHYIFFLPLDGEIPYIIAVLHERMDCMLRLQKRLV